jgi:hypothetical protein
MNPIPEWQQRVIDEASELEARLAKLNDYLGKPVEVISGSPAAEHRRLLVRQASEMTAYATTLRERMGLFAELV